MELFGNDGPRADLDFFPSQNQNPYSRKSKLNTLLPNSITSMFTPLHSKVYLVTGANTGLGLDATRQLALKASTKKVYLACRTESKARQAIAYLLENHQIPPTKLAFVPFNASDSNTAITTKIVDAIPADEKLDGLIFNAGGIGFDKTGLPTGPNHVLDQIQINIIGHIHLLNALKSAGFLKINETAIVFSGSEAARGVPIMGLAAPKLPSTTEDYTFILEGSSLKSYRAMDYYALVKGIGALYWAEWARRNPEYFVLTVSPGATSGTDIATHDGMPKAFRVMMPVMMKVMRPLGITHGLETGAKRYVDGVSREGEFQEFKSGAFVASAHGVAGLVSDQATRKQSRASQYADISKQLAAYEAIQVYA
jgi:NAD(P)-dependent dehydrogenase (short-subunit alcohol dehydrogenase family)